MADQPDQKPEEKAAEPAAEPKPAESKPEAAATETPEETGAPVEDEAKVAEQEAMAKQQAAEEALAAEAVQEQDLRPGMTVRVHQRIKEGEKERVQIFQGIIIALRGKTPATKTMTVQKHSFGVMVEKIFPLASPLIEKIEVVKIAKVRRAKLYYLRDYSKRLKETLVQQ
jgi:large subunit ribosomal protein L19